jgi:hypothetical protein
MKDVQKVYIIFDNIFEILKTKNIIYKKQHFKIQIDYDQYKNNGNSFVIEQKE